MQKDQNKDNKPKQTEQQEVKRPKESGGTEGQPSTNPNERTTVTKRG